MSYNVVQERVPLRDSTEKKNGKLEDVYACIEFNEGVFIEMSECVSWLVGVKQGKPDLV